jgi:hypothetical protein
MNQAADVKFLGEFDRTLGLIATQNSVEIFVLRFARRNRISASRRCHLDRSLTRMPSVIHS